MSLTVTRSRVKDKCGVEVTDFDASIDSLIAEWVPVIEYLVRPEHVADTGNTGLAATLNLGATEVVCGELLGQFSRRMGGFSTVELGVLRLSWPPGASDPSGLARQGWARLAPYLKQDPAAMVAGTVATGGGKSPGPEGEPR